MNSRTSFFITIVNFVLLLIVIVFLFFRFSSDNERIVYVDNISLFNGFNMAKDLNRINGEKIKKQKKTLDSLYTIYGIFRDNGKADKLETLEAQLRNEDQELKQMNERFSNEVSQAVWGRLNLYVKEYGRANGYRIVLGTQGNGNVMYAEKGIDITDEVLEYANKNYEGDR